MREHPRHPERWDERVVRLGYFSENHPRLYRPLVIECRLMLGAWHGGPVLAGLALVGKGLAGPFKRLGFRLRRFLHRFGWHDRRGLHPYGECSLCEAERIDAELTRELDEDETERLLRAIFEDPDPLEQREDDPGGGAP